MQNKTIKQIVDSIFCRNCEMVDIKEGNIRCRDPKCDCSEQVPMPTVLDLYANIYYIVEGINSKNFYTMSVHKHFDDTIRSDKQRITDIWDQHMSAYNYSDYRSENLSYETISLIKSDLLSKTDNISLLFCLVTWLIVLDHSLLNLHEVYLLRCKMFRDTYRGRIVLTVGSKFSDFVRERLEARGIYFPIDANYTSMRYLVTHFHLIHRGNEYEVIHLPVEIGSEKNGEEIGELRVGFIPGSLTAEDYLWDVDDKSSPYKFTFSGISKGDHEEFLTKTIKSVLESEPNMIILPELLTPAETQLKIIKLMKEHNIDTFKDGWGPTLLSTGTFHQKLREGSAPYNVGQVAINGFKKFDVFKLNVFRIKARISYKGKLSKFSKTDGIEGISIDKNCIHLIESPLGRIAIFVCIDFITDEIDRILIAYQVDVVIVMAYTPNPSSGKFEREFLRLGERVNSTVIICNNTGDAKNDERVVVFFPGLSEPYKSSDVVSVKTINEMLELAIAATLIAKTK